MMFKFGHSYDGVFNDAEVFLIGLKGLKYEQTSAIVNHIGDMVIGFSITPSNKSDFYQTIDIGLGLLYPFVDRSLYGDVVRVESKNKNFCYTGSMVDILDMLITVEKYTMKELSFFERRKFSGVNIRLNIEDLCVLYDVDRYEVKKRLLIERDNIMNVKYS